MAWLGPPARERGMTEAAARQRMNESMNAAFEILQKKLDSHEKMRRCKTNYNDIESIALNDAPKPAMSAPACYRSLGGEAEFDFFKGSATLSPAMCKAATKYGASMTPKPTTRGLVMPPRAPHAPPPRDPGPYDVTPPPPFDARLARRNDFPEASFPPRKRTKQNEASCLAFLQHAKSPPKRPLDDGTQPMGLEPADLSASFSLRPRLD